MSKKYYKHFDPAILAADTNDTYSARYYTSWVNVCRLLEKRGFNRFEAEAFLRSKHVRWARDEFGGTRTPTANTVAKYLDKHNYKSGCKELNELVLGTFPQFEPNVEGVPCERGTMPGNPTAGETLVPVGTPTSCNPHSELYWSM